MHAFERVLHRGIPTGEALNFFHRVKTAGWADPPDESGALEGQFAAPIEQVVLKLTEVVAAKFKLMVAYHVYAESMRGVAQHEVSEVFHEHAEQERAAAEAYLKRAAVLGGGPIHLPDEIQPPPASSDPVGILSIIVRAEQEAIALQRELKGMVGEENPLNYQIEQFMIEDQHHHDEAWQMLPPEVQAQMAAPPPEPMPEEMPAPEAPPPEAAAAPPKEEKPSPKEEKMAAAMRKAAGDLIEFPGKTERMMRQAKKGLSGAAETGTKALKEGINRLPMAGKAGLAGGLYGAVLGGVGGGLGAATRSPDEEQELIDNGGPVTRFAVNHPVLSGAAMGGASLGGGIGALVATRNQHPVVQVASGLGGLLAPRILATAADRALKKDPEPRPPVADSDPDYQELLEMEAQEQAQKRMKTAFAKLAFGGQPQQEPGFGNDPGAAPMPTDQPMQTSMPSMEQPGQQPPMANPPGTGSQFSPVNYLEAEETARRAQAANEAEFYRGKVEESGMQIQGMQQQLQQSQAQLEQLQAQANESQSQIMQANQEAVQANDQMLNQATLAARMRMGMQQLRAQMMEIASQDPEQLAAAAGGPTPMDVGNQAQMAAGGAAPAAGGGGAPMDPGLNGEGAVTEDPNAMAGAQPGTPEAAATGGPAPGQAPAGAGAPDNGGSAPEESQKGSGEGDKKDGAETTVSIKKGSIVSEITGALPYGAVGGALGAGRAYMNAKSGKGMDALRDQVDVLKGNQDGGFGKAMELAKAQLALGKAEEARANPGRAALSGAAQGAGMGMGLGMAVPAAISGGKSLLKNIQTYRNLG